MDSNKLRREYKAHNGNLLEHNASPDPFEQFEKWFADAVNAKLDLPDAMTLATATPPRRSLCPNGSPQRL